MSGYNPAMGIFEMTSTQMHRWFRRTEIPESFRGKTFKTHEHLCAALLRDAGYEVVKSGGNYLRVRATQAQNWEVLSGTPSDPNHYHSRLSDEG
jgi:hypothetical protein